MVMLFMSGCICNYEMIPQHVTCFLKTPWRGSGML